MRASLQTALAAWGDARGTAEHGKRTGTGLAYHRALHHLQLHVSTLRGVPRAEVRDELDAACHALSILGREAVPKVLASRATHFAAIHARVALAAAHLADPAQGDGARVALALDGPSIDRFDPDGAGDVPPSERIASAADVRMMTARLVADHPPAHGAKGKRWPVTTTGGAGFVAVYRDRRCFRRAVLPSCLRLGAEGEALQLGLESVRLHAALARALPSHSEEHDRAQEEFMALAHRLGLTPPRVD
jgi:hypothetical protein